MENLVVVIDYRTQKWGKGKTLPEALKNASARYNKKCLSIFVAKTNNPEDVSIDVVGNWQGMEFEPVQIQRALTYLRNELFASST